MKKTIITSMTLFAVVLAYIALRSPVDTTETAKPAVAKTKSEKSQTAKPKESAAAAFRNSRYASAEDWAKVNAIAAQYAPELKALEAKRNRILEDPNATKSCYGSDGTPDLEAIAARLKRDLAEKAIRDKERELWEELSLHLSPYELREYKMKHSQTARELREGSAWFEPSKADFLALYTYREKRNDVLDSQFGGDILRQQEWLESVDKKWREMQEKLIASGKNWKQRLPVENKFWRREVKYVDYTTDIGRNQQTLREMMGSDRVDKYFAGPNAAIEKPYFEGMKQADELFARGEITGDEWDARHQKLEEEYNAALKSAAGP